MKWHRVPGKRDWIANAGDRHFLIHVGHGELWYALEYADAAHAEVVASHTPFEGPRAMDAARELCEYHATQTKRRGLMKDRP